MYIITHKDLIPGGSTKFRCSLEFSLRVNVKWVVCTRLTLMNRSISLAFACNSINLSGKKRNQLFPRRPCSEMYFAAEISRFAERKNPQIRAWAISFGSTVFAKCVNNAVLNASKQVERFARMLVQSACHLDCELSFCHFIPRTEAGCSWTGNVSQSLQSAVHAYSVSALSQSSVRSFVGLFALIIIHVMSFFLNLQGAPISPLFAFCRVFPQGMTA